MSARLVIPIVVGFEFGGQMTLGLALAAEQVH
jgi:hypothetical protein